MTTWQQTLLVALLAMVATKIVDHFATELSDERNFKRHRREYILSEIEELKDQIRVLYEIASNWKSFDSKQQDYVEQFGQESQILGKYNKYPAVATAARDVTHYCKIVAHSEKNHLDDLALKKTEMANMFAIFIDACEAHLKSLV